MTGDKRHTDTGRKCRPASPRAPADGGGRTRRVTGKEVNSMAENFNVVKRTLGVVMENGVDAHDEMT